MAMSNGHSDRSISVLSYVGGIHTEDVDSYIDNEDTQLCQPAFPQGKTMIDFRAKHQVGITQNDNVEPLRECHPQIVGAFDITPPTRRKQTNYTSLAYITKSLIILADSENKCCDLYTIDGGTPVTEIKFSSAPFGLASMGHQRVAVTLPEERKLRILDMIDEQLVPTRDILTRWCCYGLGVMGNDRLATFFDFPSLGAFGIFDELDGRELCYVEIPAEKLLSFAEKEANMNYFKKNAEKVIGVGKTSDLLINIISRKVKDINKNYLVGIYPDKKIGFTCRWRGEQGCAGIGVDRCGDIYVFYHNVIDRLSPSGDSLGAYKCPSGGSGTMETAGFHPDGEGFLVVIKTAEFEDSVHKRRKVLIVKIQ